MNEIVREFLLESHENLAQLDVDLVTLEKEPREKETLARVFRTIHTVKGTSGFLGLAKLEGVAHAGENLLSKLRDGRLLFNPEIASALLGMVDAIRKMLATLEATAGASVGEGDYSALIGKLDELTNQATSSSAVRAPSIVIPPAPAKPVESVVESKPVPLPTPVKPAPVDAAPAPLSSESNPVRPSAPAAPEPTEPRVASVSDTAIRVDVGLLDKLMNIVGEMVLARNQILQFSVSQEDPAFLDAVQRMNLLTTELQAGVMKTRMQPIGNVWGKFPRVVRDLAIACHKQVRIDMDGQETELDKTIIEAIRDPLTHMVRNAVDHGIEPPATRTACGKAAEGRLRLHAFHEGGKVIIEISDDGGGIDPQRVREKAVQNGVIAPELAARMGERELINLVFLPGFTTTDRVTNFSGRGVGMDVVRTNIEKIGGTVDIESVLGRGTTVKMKIPLTLAIIPALIISSGGDRYAIPQVSLLELVRMEGDQARRGIELIHGAAVYRLRGNLLPLVYLNRQLQVESASGRVADANEINIVVLQAEDRQFGLIVDAIHDTEEIVVKPLQKQLKGIAVFAGATIMGDGKVALILDVLGLAQRSKVVTGMRERSMSEKSAPIAEKTADRQSVLLFSAPDGGRMAIPLSLVARLEEFPGSAIERVGNQQVVQYRDEILPLIDVSRALRRQARERKGGRRRQKKVAANRNDTVQVVVYAGQRARVGLIVGCILDIAEEDLATRSRSGRRGVLFTAVVQGRVTEFLDIEAIIRSADPEFDEHEQTIGAEA